MDKCKCHIFSKTYDLNSHWMRECTVCGYKELTEKQKVKNENN